MSTNRDRLLNFLLGWALLTAALPTLIVYRAVLQPRYQWGLFGITGQGVTPGLLVIVAAALLAWAAVVLGGLGIPTAGSLLVALNAMWFTSILVGMIRLGSELTFRGDAWGVSINLAVMGPLLFGALLLLSVWWSLARGRRPLFDVPFTSSRTRRVLFGAALALLPIIIALFAAGDGLVHTWRDRLAVVCVIAQCLFVGAGLRPDTAPSHRRSVEPV